MVNTLAGSEVLRLRGGMLAFYGSYVYSLLVLIFLGYAPSPFVCEQSSKKGRECQMRGSAAHESTQVTLEEKL